MKSTAPAPPRRVVTGLTPDGRSCIWIDGPSQSTIWSTDSAVADNASPVDGGRDRMGFPSVGTRFVFVDFPPHDSKRMHATDTIDYLVVVSGEVTFITETGETTLRAGDVLVDRGALHGWRNDTDAPCRIVNVLTPAAPLGAGATIKGEI